MWLSVVLLYLGLYLELNNECLVSNDLHGLHALSHLLDQPTLFDLILTTCAYKVKY